MKHIEHAWHANGRGLGACPQENLKTDHLKLDLRAFQGHSCACYISYMTN